jgi:8-oxo-dGTP pyrophosphatase MutT (NUDIX family)
MHDLRVAVVERLDLRLTPLPWRFADERRADIDAYFADMQRRKPVWNGRMLLLHEWALDGLLLHGAFLETDFASYIAWRDWGFPDAGVTNCFAQGALRAADGAFLLGVMGAHTAGAGSIYFPSGTPDPKDVTGGTVDLDLSVMRELREETGLTAADVSVAPSWHAVIAGPRIALMKSLQAAEPADALREKILRHLAAEDNPELSDIRIVRGPENLDPRMPAFIAAFLRHAWR